MTIPYQKSVIQAVDEAETNCYNTLRKRNSYMKFVYSSASQVTHPENSPVILLYCGSFIYSLMKHNLICIQ